MTGGTAGRLTAGHEGVFAQIVRSLHQVLKAGVLGRRAKDVERVGEGVAFLQDLGRACHGGVRRKSRCLKLSLGGRSRRDPAQL